VVGGRLNYTQSPASDDKGDYALPPKEGAPAIASSRPPVDASAPSTVESSWKSATRVYSPTASSASSNSNNDSSNPDDRNISSPSSSSRVATSVGVYSGAAGQKSEESGDLFQRIMAEENARLEKTFEEQERKKRGSSVVASDFHPSDLLPRSPCSS